MLHNKIIRPVFLGIALSLAMCLVAPADVLAFGLADLPGSFSFSYSSNIGQSSLYAGESLNPTITGVATCNADLPIEVSEATLSGRVIAQGPNGERVILNSGYTVSISGFPTKRGESVQESQTVQLAFPSSMAPGQYNIVGEVISARVKVILWFNVTSYVPSSINLGSVTILEVPPPPTTTPEPTLPPTTIPTITPTTTPPTAPPTAAITVPVPNSTPTLPPTSTRPSTTTPPTVTTTILTPTSTVVITVPAPIPSTGTTKATVTTAPFTTGQSSTVLPAESGTATTTEAKTELPPTTAQIPGYQTSSSTEPTERSGKALWFLLPLWVGGLTLLLVILAMLRTSRIRSEKEDYKFTLPPED